MSFLNRLFRRDAPVSHGETQTPGMALQQSVQMMPARPQLPTLKQVLASCEPSGQQAEAQQVEAE
jgi:hypothetical protein